MRCEECLPLIEEYVDGELDGRIIERLETHMRACANCSDELALLRREQEVYANYRRELEVTPADWNVVRARIEQERDAHQPEHHSRLAQWLGRFSGAGSIFRPAFVAALLLIAIGITALIIFTNARAPRSDVASRREEPSVAPMPAKTVEVKQPEKRNESTATIAPGGSAQEKAPQPNRRTIPQVAAPRGPNQRNVVAAASLPRAAKRPAGRAPSADSPRFEEALYDARPLGIRRAAPEATGDFDFELARHAERAELLLRSFRNARPAETRRALDVAYEKAQSRKLLYQNIALRRDAASRGDQTAAELLDTLEPILLDIANLPDRVRARDVRPIEQRMEKKEIVAALQVRNLVASN